MASLPPPDSQIPKGERPVTCTGWLIRNAATPRPARSWFLLPFPCLPFSPIPSPCIPNTHFPFSSVSHPGAYCSKISIKVSNSVLANKHVQTKTDRHKYSAAHLVSIRLCFPCRSLPFGSRATWSSWTFTQASLNIFESSQTPYSMLYVSPLLYISRPRPERITSPRV